MKRLDVPGQARELTFSCHGRLPLLSKDRTRGWLVEAIEAARARWGFKLWAYVVMPEHVHLLVLPASDGCDVAAIVRAIKQPVAMRAMHHLRDHAPDWLRRLEVVTQAGEVKHRFWLAGGGYDRNITEPSTVHACIDYLHENPVRRGLVATGVEWSWSSARWYAGLDDGPLRIDQPEI
jgi:putative transposase